MSERVIYEFFLLRDGQDRDLWSPAADSYQTSRGWLLKLDLAGVRPDDVKVLVRGCQVTVEGVRRDVLLEDVSAPYSMEISYNRFRRTIDLPCDLEDPEIELTVRDGFLFVHLSERGHERS